ncbi:MAG: hypothetical protein E7028_09480 [Planctomycetaceae bacterium]|nr:hypothetical protein [Planctomycetaceae bacterium]
MNSQSETVKPKDTNVSELEMVGALLFGSISGEPTTNVEVIHSSKENRMVNLGSRIAPENTRQWEAEKPEYVLNSRDSEIISAILPERKNPSPIQDSSNLSKADEEILGEVHVSKHTEHENLDSEEVALSRSLVSVTKKSSVRPITVLYGSVLMLLTVCVVFLGWQVYSDENTSVSSAEKSQVEATVEAVALAEPKVESVSVPEAESVPESGFASAEPVEANFDAPIPSSEVAQEEYPTFNSSLGGALDREIPAVESIPSGQPIGNAVAVEEESYPIFNANLGTQESVSAVSAPAPTQVYAQNPAVPAGNLNTVPGTEWNVGSAMEEVPVFNSEMSKFNTQSAQNTYAQQMPQSAPLAPQVAPMAPQFGNQAMDPAAPRKLTPPNAQQTNDFSTPNEEEIYPSFNPEIGIDSSIPVSYY